MFNYDESTQKFVYNMLEEGYSLEKICNFLRDGLALRMGYIDGDEYLVTDAYNFACELIEAEKRKEIEVREDGTIWVRGGCRECPTGPKEFVKEKKIKKTAMWLSRMPRWR